MPKSSKLGQMVDLCLVLFFFQETVLVSIVTCLGFGASGPCHQTEDLGSLSRLRPQGVSELRMAGVEPPSRQALLVLEQVTMTPHWEDHGNQSRGIKTWSSPC